MYWNHLVNHIENPELVTDSTLHVIRVITNPVRYHSRYRLARKQEEDLSHCSNMKLYTVEAAFGDRHHEVTISSDGRHLQLRTNSEIWCKENLINLGIKHLLPKNWKYLAWIDGDINFIDKDWALKSIHQLQHYPVIQPWSDCMDLGPYGNVFQHFKSFGHQHQKRIPKQKWPAQPYQYAHTGFAWACTRAFWENIGGLMDFPILGSSDHHMGFGMIGEIKDTIHGGMGEAFFRKCKEWEAKAIRITKKEVGFIMGRIEHFFHGPKKRRYYRERWQILIDHKFNPDTDLMYDAQGMIQLCGKPELEQAIRLYNRSRYEDSIEEV